MEDENYEMSANLQTENMLIDSLQRIMTSMTIFTVSVSINFPLLLYIYHIMWSKLTAAEIVKFMYGIQAYGGSAFISTT